MKSKIKIDYVEAETIDELKETINKEIEAIQVNIKNVIKDVETINKPNGGFIAQILYEEIEEPKILNESEVLD